MTQRAFVCDSNQPIISPRFFSFFQCSPNTL